MEFGDFSMAPSSSEVELDKKLYTMLDLEAKRYKNFFGTLDEHQHKLLPRDVVLAFYGKSALSEHGGGHFGADMFAVFLCVDGYQEIAEMYQLIKSLHLHHDLSAMNETEFITGMHFIVCITKRSLAKLPPTFPKYLFPTLDLTPSTSFSAFSSHANSISSMPSPDKEDMVGGGSSLMSGFAGISLNGSAAGSSYGVVGDASSSSDAAVPGTLSTNDPFEKLQDAKSFSQLLEKEIHNKRVEASALSRLDQSETKALQSLHGCLELIAENVEKLGYPVPLTARSVDALDDFGNLLRSHVQATKQEIQSMEISAQMLSVASESSSPDVAREDPFQEIAVLTQQLAVFQQQASQLHQKKETLVRQLHDAKVKSQQTQQPASLPAVAPPSSSSFAPKALDESFGASHTGGFGAPTEMNGNHVEVTAPAPSNGSTGWGDFGSTAAQEVRNSESVQRAESNPFEFGGSPLSSAPVSSEAAFEWGSFS